MTAASLARRTARRDTACRRVDPSTAALGQLTITVDVIVDVMRLTATIVDMDKQAFKQRI